MTSKMKNILFPAILGFAFVVTPLQADEDTPLAEQMDIVSSSLKGLRKAETTADKVKLVQEAQAATIKALAYLPAIFVDIKDEKEKAKATADFKMLVGQSYAKFCELELAFLEEDEVKIEQVQNDLKALKKQGHDKYVE